MQQTSVVANRREKLAIITIAMHQLSLSIVGCIFNSAGIEVSSSASTYDNHGLRRPPRVNK